MDFEKFMGAVGIIGAPIALITGILIATGHLSF